MPTALLGLAHYLPPAQPVGSVRRPVASEPGGPSDLALEPARHALAQAGLLPDAVEFLIFATMTPDVTFPGSACFFQDKFGLGTIGALDVRGQCAGFLTGLMVAELRVPGCTARARRRRGDLIGPDYSGQPGGGSTVRRRGRGRRAGRARRRRPRGGLPRPYYERFWIEYPSAGSNCASPSTICAPAGTFPASTSSTSRASAARLPGWWAGAGHGNHARGSTASS